MKGFALLAFLLVIVSSPAHAKNEDHFDTIIRYRACDVHPGPGPKWTARWAGNAFYHTPGPGAPGVPHRDSIINYQTWDGSCWTAHWDADKSVFVHTRFHTSNAHFDKVLNYLTWDNGKWAAVKDGNGFYHIYVAPPSTDNKSIGKQVYKFFDQNMMPVEVTLQAITELAIP